MDLRGCTILLICLSAVYCDLIDFRKAAEIFKTLPHDISDDFNSRSIFSDPVVRFIDFMQDHDKVYASREELFERHDNFVTNVERAEDIQVKDKGSAEFGINKFSDFSDEEFQKLLGLTIRPQDNFRSLKQDDRTEREKMAIDWVKKAQDVPKAMDWREKGVITKVKDQASCQGCWAFSAVGLVEAMHAIQTKELRELSEQQLLDCDTDDEGCNGGLMETALDYAINNGGLELENDYPFEGKSTINGCKARVSDGRPRVQVANYTMIPSGKEDAMKVWVAQHGPLSVGMNGRILTFYSRGILDLDEYECDPMLQDHAILVVGYGEEDIRGKSTPYWIVKNSWGPTWGEKGYFRIRRGENTCGISYYVLGALTK